MDSLWRPPAGPTAETTMVSDNPIPEPEPEASLQQHRGSLVETSNPTENAPESMTNDEAPATVQPIDQVMESPVTFEQVSSGFPDGLTDGHRRLLEILYLCIASGNYFTLNDFTLLNQVAKKMLQLKPALLEAFETILTHDINLDATCVQFVEYFAAQDLEKTGFINERACRSIISTILEKPDHADSEFLRGIYLDLDLIEDAPIDMIDFVTWLPYLVNLMHQVVETDD